MKKLQTFAHVQNPVIRQVLEANICDDTIADALSATKDALAADIAIGAAEESVLDKRINAFEEADHAWNERGNVGDTLEALREFWTS